jgi:hypothetical protein
MPRPPHLSISLWLLPQGPIREDLRALIATLARETSGPAFEPHVTLLSGIEATADGLRDGLGALAADLPDLQLGQPVVGDTRHQCVLLPVEPAEALLPLRHRAEALFAKPRAPFFPHLSVVYGDLPAAARHALCADARLRSFSGRPLRLSSIAPWRTDGPEERWYPIPCVE